MFKKEGTKVDSTKKCSKKILKTTFERATKEQEKL